MKGMGQTDRQTNIAKITHLLINCIRRNVQNWLRIILVLV